MSFTFLIRKVKPEDNQDLARLIRTVMPEFGAVGAGFAIADPEVDCMYQTYQNPRSVYYTVELDGKIAGAGGLAHLRGAAETVCEIQKMYFFAHLRGLGAGSRLLDQLLVDAKAFGYLTVYLETMCGMHSAQALYRSKGFVALSEPMGNTGHGGCDRWFSRPL